MGNSAGKRWEDEDQSVPYTPIDSGKYRVWLLGDSILDNSYWNGVEENMTGE